MRLLSSLRVHLCLLFAFSMLTRALFAQDIVLTTGEWDPYTGKDLKKGGFISEIVSKALEAEGFNIKEMHFKPWKKAQTLVKKKPKKYQATFPWFSTDERRRDFYYSQKLVDTINVFVVKKGSKLTSISSFDDLKGKKVGASLGYSYGKDFDDRMKNKSLTIVKVKSDIEGIKQVISGKIDAFPLEKYVAKALLAQHKSQGKVSLIQTPAFKPAPVHLIVGKKHKSGDSLVKKFNAGLKKIQDNGTYDKIITEAFK